MGNDFLLDMLIQSKENSTNIDNETSDNLIIKRDKLGNLCSYDIVTGKKIGRIYEHGNDNIAKTFNDLL